MGKAPRTLVDHLTDAAYLGDLPALERCLAQGAAVNQGRQIDSMTALHLAAMAGRTPVVERLLAAGAETTVLTRLGAHTPLDLAARSGHADCIVALLRGGADPNRPDGMGHTPLVAAAMNGHAEAVGALLGGGADRTYVVPAMGLNAAQIAARLAASKDSEPHRLVASLIAEYDERPAARMADLASRIVVEYTVLDAVGPQAERPQPLSRPAATRAVDTSRASTVEEDDEPFVNDSAPAKFVLLLTLIGSLAKAAQVYGLWKFLG